MDLLKLLSETNEQLMQLQKQAEDAKTAAKNLSAEIESLETHSSELLTASHLSRAAAADHTSASMVGKAVCASLHAAIAQRTATLVETSTPAPTTLATLIHSVDVAVSDLPGRVSATSEAVRKSLSDKEASLAAAVSAADAATAAASRDAITEASASSKWSALKKKAEVLDKLMASRKSAVDAATEELSALRAAIVTAQGTLHAETAPDEASLEAGKAMANKAQLEGRLAAGKKEYAALTGAAWTG